MSAVDLMKRLNKQGVEVSLDGENLRVRGAENVLTSELTEEMRRLKPELIELLTPRRDGTDLQRLAYDVRDVRLIAQCRTKAVAIQQWLTDHFDEHMDTDPPGSPDWIAGMVEFNFIERDQLRSAYRYQGCIHGNKRCPGEVPVNCTACEGRDG